VPGLAVANIDAVIVNSNAYKTAAEQRKATYKSTYDAAEARSKQLNAQIQPMVTKLQADSKAAKPNQAALQQQYVQIQQLQESGKQELQQILQPVALSEAYVNEQISDKLEAAIQAAMNKQKITVVLGPQSVVAAAAAYNLNQDILNELNTALPTAQLVPPAGWEPREVREAKAAQAQAQGAAAAPARPAGPQPTGR
jgi:Skp family chaperone for outer membrane proteins